MEKNIEVQHIIKFKTKQNSFKLGWYAECCGCGWNSALHGSEQSALNAGKRHDCWKNEDEDFLC